MTRKDDALVAYTITCTETILKLREGQVIRPGRLVMATSAGTSATRSTQASLTPYLAVATPSRPSPYVPVVYKNFRVHPHCSQNKCVSRLAFYATLPCSSRNHERISLQLPSGSPNVFNPILKALTHQALGFLNDVWGANFSYSVV